MGIVKALIASMLKEISPELDTTCAMSFAFNCISGNIENDVQGSVVWLLNSPDDRYFTIISDGNADTIIKYDPDLQKFVLSTRYKDSKEKDLEVHEEAIQVVSYVEVAALLNVSAWKRFINDRNFRDSNELERLRCLTQAY